MFITIPIVIFIVIVGLVFGSFFSVVVDRLTRAESIVFPRSHCPHCQKVLKAYDLIPLFSYLILKGKCRNCKNRISLLNPLIECFTALGFTLIFLDTPQISSLFISLGLFSLLLIVTMTDLLTLIIPDKVLISFAVYFMLIKIWFFNPHMVGLDFLGSVLGLSCPLCIWFIFRGGIGVGDIKLFGLLGLVLGPTDIFYCILLSCVIGLVGFLCLFLGNSIQNHRLKMNSCSDDGLTTVMLPFAPFISIGALIVYFFRYNPFIVEKFF